MYNSSSSLLHYHLLTHSPLIHRTTILLPASTPLSGISHPRYPLRFHIKEDRVINSTEFINAKGVKKKRMKLRYAMVCSSNQNRSMESHFVLKKQGFDVSSYGTGTQVKLPGPSIREPNVYDFGTPYKLMYEELRRKDPELYKRNGILPMLKRNLSVKLAPQRWQDNADDGAFDVVFTFEERVFDMVAEDLHNRDQVLMKPVAIINLEVKDNHEEAAIGARLTLDLCQELEATESWVDKIDDIISTFERQHRRKIFYTISFY